MTKGRRIVSDGRKLKYIIVGYHRKYDMLFLKSGNGLFYQKPGGRIKKYITEEDGPPNGFVPGAPPLELMDRFPISTRKYLQHPNKPSSGDEYENRMD